MAIFSGLRKTLTPHNSHLQTKLSHTLDDTKNRREKQNNNATFVLGVHTILQGIKQTRTNLEVYIHVFDTGPLVDLVLN